MESNIYNNPIVVQRADPCIYKHTDGYYYWLNSDGSSSNVAWKKTYSGDSCWVHKATNSNDYYKSVTYAFSSGDDAKNVGFDSKGWATTCSGW